MLVCSDKEIHLYSQLGYGRIASRLNLKSETRFDSPSYILLLGPKINEITARPTAIDMAKDLGSTFMAIVKDSRPIFADQMIVKYRREKCSSCSYHTGNLCRACACFTDAKTKLSVAKCPKSKW